MTRISIRARRTSGSHVTTGGARLRLVPAMGVLAVAVLTVTACGAGSTGHHAAAPGTGQPSAAAGSPSTPASSRPAASAAASAPASSPPLVAMQTPAGGEFASPSGNITCEVDYNFGSNKLTHAYCQTGAPARSVTMSVTGTFTTCTGLQCLGNSGINTPTLAYGQATGVGPFVCESATTGITCRADGRGFLISGSGITPV